MSIQVKRALKERESQMPEPKYGDLRVIHYPQVPCDPFEVRVDSLAQAKLLVDALADYDMFQYANRIKPDYCNATSVQHYVADSDGDWTPGWCDWSDDETGAEFDDLSAEDIANFDAAKNGLKEVFVVQKIDYESTEILGIYSDKSVAGKASVLLAGNQMFGVQLDCVPDDISTDLLPYVVVIRGGAVIQCSRESVVEFVDGATRYFDGWHVKLWARSKEEARVEALSLIARLESQPDQRGDQS